MNMTPEEFAKKMKDIAGLGDPEEKHIAADDLMRQLLRQLGYGEGVDIFKDMDIWYA